MTSLFWVSYGVLWLVLAILVMLVVLLYRQFGLMIMPGSQRISYAGLNVGAQAPPILVRPDSRNEMAYDWTSSALGNPLFQATFAIFAMPGCPLCDSLATDESVALIAQRYPSIRFIWIDSGKKRDHSSLSEWTHVSSRHASAHGAMDIPGTPFAYLVSADTRILSKGIVNHLDDIDTMIVDSTSYQDSTL